MDRRFHEASKLVNQTRPPVVECTPEPQWSEADLLEAQKELAQFVTRRDFVSRLWSWDDAFQWESAVAHRACAHTCFQPTVRDETSTCQ